MARPTKQTENRKAVVVKALKLGNTRTAAAASAKISYQTFTRMLRDDPVFAEEVAEAESAAEMALVGYIKKAATPHEVTVIKQKETPEGVLIETTIKREHNWQAAAWLLDRRFYQNWRQRKTIDVSKLSAEQLLELDSLLEEEEIEGEGEEGVESPGDFTSEATSID